MPFGENGPIDEESRRRLNQILGLMPPDMREDEILGIKAEAIREQLESEAEQADGTADEITRADILRRAYTERFV